MPILAFSQSGSGSGSGGGTGSKIITNGLGSRNIVTNGLGPANGNTAVNVTVQSPTVATVKRTAAYHLTIGAATKTAANAGRVFFITVTAQAASAIRAVKSFAKTVRAAVHSVANAVVTPHVTNQTSVYVPGSGQVQPPPQQAVKPTPPIPNFASALTPGSINKKYVVYLGLQSADGHLVSIVPRGTFVAQSATGTEQNGAIQQALHCFDIVTEFDFPIYNDLPHPLYGNQNDVRYDANYNLTNPSGDGKTWVCDAKAFMRSITDNAFFSAIWKDIFGAISAGAPVNVYVGSPTSIATTPEPANTFNWFPESGTIVFTSPKPANSIISIDGVPQGMAPEKMIQHLFTDYANWDVSAMSLQTSNTVLPTYTGGRGRTVWQVAQDIAAITAPRFVSWQIRVDEYGQINFYESKIATVPSETLTDQRDIFNINYTLTTQQLENVVTANSVSNTNQPLQSVAYNVPSVNDDGERAPYQIPANLLFATRGMPSTEAISVMNTAAASALDERSRPKLQLVCDVLPNYNRQVGDKITIIEQQLGLSGPYIIRGIEDRITNGVAVQTLRLSRANIFANMNMGLPIGVTNATAQTLALNTAPVGNRTGIIDTVNINGIGVISGGVTVKDPYGAAVLPVVTPIQPWTFFASIDPTQAYDTAVFHYIYFDVGNTLAGNSVMAFTLPNFDQGKVTPATTIGGGYTISDSHMTGTLVNSSEGLYLYDHIIVAGTATTIPEGWNAFTATVNNTPAAQPYLGNLTQYGIGVGPNFGGGSAAYLPVNKQSYGYFCILAANANGAMSFLRIPFLLSL